ncbi:hypothetical protein M569_09413 [Genlisea aurea]|uniref:Uncharacterized protein n=1 Tax=Genlisea aurea TaxID=192259 RepID=S8CEP3_9LAMI|nr:hypothetical protein M569_09413 [Genlisea aurea]
MGGCATKPKDVDSDSAPVDPPATENPIREVKDDEVESKKVEDGSESSPAGDGNAVVEKDVIVKKESKEEEESKPEPEPKSEEEADSKSVVFEEEKEKKDEIQSA